MQVFEFHFNPKLKPDLIFDSFCYEADNIYEKRMGALYVVGTLQNVLPQNRRFIEKLAKTIKEKYYRLTSSTPAKSLKDSLKKAKAIHLIEVEEIKLRAKLDAQEKLVNIGDLQQQNLTLTFQKPGGIFLDFRKSKQKSSRSR